MIQFISICLHIDWQNEKLVMREREIYEYTQIIITRNFSNIYLFFGASFVCPNL